MARALVLEPKVLLFDEPLSNLDAKLRRRVREDIRRLQRDLNLTVAYVTHDQEEALAVSDRVIVMSNAAIAQSGTPRELYEQPASLFVADFIGDSNIVPIEIESVSGDRAVALYGEARFELPSRGAKPGAAKLGLRPDAINLSAAAAPDALPGRILHAAYLGKHMEYTVLAGGAELFVVDRRVKQPLAVGDETNLTFDRDGMTVLPA